MPKSRVDGFTDCRSIFSACLNSSAPLPARRRPAAGDCEADRRHLVRRETPDAARRHRFGQDVHRRQRHQKRATSRRWSFRTTKRWPRSFTPSSKAFFRNNAVEYFVSYFDYYQPEAYIPRTDTFIEKDSSRNEEIERLRLSTMSSLFTRRDVVVVASVSCIYGIGSKEDYEALVIPMRVGQDISREQFLARLVDLQYDRNDIAFERGHFRVRGDTVEVRPAGREDGLRMEFFGEEIERLTRFEPLTGNKIESLDAVMIFPGETIRHDRRQDEARHPGHPRGTGRAHRLSSRRDGKLLEAQRIKQRTEFDLEMMEEMGVCSGIENYSRHIAGRPPGSRPATLFDFFPNDYLLVIDESHATVPQIGGDVRGRPLAQNGPGGARLPPAERAGQPPAEFPGISGAAKPDDLRQRHAGAAGARMVAAERRSADPRQLGNGRGGRRVRPASWNWSCARPD